MKNFNNLVVTLKENGYDVQVKQYESYKFATVLGRSIKGGFCSIHDKNDMTSNYYLNNKICIDNKETFDRWRNCPLQYILPSTFEEVFKLMERMEYWGSDDGREESSDFGYDSGNYKD